MPRSVAVWRCGDQPVAGSGSSPPPLALLVYLLGPTGAAMGRDVFRFMDGSDPALGPLVVVTDSSLTRPPLLRGPPARYTCRLLQTLPAMVEGRYPFRVARLCWMEAASRATVHLKGQAVQWK